MTTDAETQQHWIVIATMLRHVRNDSTLATTVGATCALFSDELVARRYGDMLRAAAPSGTHCSVTVRDARVRDLKNLDLPAWWADGLATAARDQPTIKGG